VQVNTFFRVFKDCCILLWFNDLGKTTYAIFAQLVDIQHFITF